MKVIIVRDEVEFGRVVGVAATPAAAVNLLLKEDLICGASGSCGAWGDTSKSLLEYFGENWAEELRKCDVETLDDIFIDCFSLREFELEE